MRESNASVPTGMAPPDAQNLIQSFRKQIQHQENILYGEAMFYECLCLLHAGQNAFLETFRKQFRNIIQLGKETIDQASVLLNDVTANPQKVQLLIQFKFSPGQGHSNPQELVKRSEILLEAYDTLFPNRPRSQPFSESETLQLIEYAGRKFHP